MKVSVQFLAELDQLRQAVPAIRGIFQQLVDLAKGVGEQTVPAAKSAGAALVDQFGVPIKKVTAELKNLTQAEGQAAAGARDTAKGAAAAGAEADKAAAAASRAGKSFRKMGEDGAAGGKGAGDGMRNASKGSQDLGDSLGSLAKKIGLAYAGLLLLRQGWAFLKEGIGFASQMETAQLGIGSLIAAQAKLTDSTGRELKGREALNAALSLSNEQVQKLKIAGLETVATTEQLVVAYQQAVGVGLSMGMNLDQVRQITIKTVQAASSLGVPMNQLAEEVRDMLQGNINPRNTRIATALQIRNEDIRAWRDAGTLFENLDKRMEAFGVAGELAAKTWQGVTSNVVEATQTMAGAMAEPLFQKLKRGLQSALEGVFDLKEARISDQFQGLVEGGRVAFGALGTIADDALQGIVRWLRDVSDWFSRNRILVQEIANNLVDLVRQVFTLAGTIRDIVSAFGLINAQSNLFSGALKVAALAVAGISDGLRLVAAGVMGTGTLIVSSMVKPLKEFLDKLADGLELVGKKEWADKLRGWGQNLQGLADSMAARTKRIFDPLAEGTGAVGTLMTAWEKADAEEGQRETKRKLTHLQALKRIAELREAIGQLERTQAQAFKGKNADLDPAFQARAKQLAALRTELADVAAQGGVNLQGRPPAREDQKNLISQGEVKVRLAKLEAELAERTTLEQEKQAKLAALKAEMLEKSTQLEKEQREGRYNRPGGQDDYKAQVQALKDFNTTRTKQIEAEYVKKREALEEDLQARLTAQEEGGLDKRLEAVRKYFKTFREDNERARKDGKPFLSDEQILAAEDAAKVRARAEQVRADIQAIQRAFTDRAQQNGGILTTDDKKEILSEFSAQGGTKADASKQVAKANGIGQGPMEGWQKGFNIWKEQVRNTFESVRDMAQSILSGVDQAFANFGTSLFQRGQDINQKMKTLWMSISSTVIQALMKMGAQHLVLWGIEKAKLAWDAIKVAITKSNTAAEVATSGTKVAANTAETTSNVGTAISGFFKAHSWIPWVGYGIAAAFVASMLGLLKPFTGRAVGGLVGQHGPEATILGEKGLEVVAPERDFKDWARGMVQMGANLQANISSQQQAARGYQQRGAAYAQAAQDNQLPEEERRMPLGGLKQIFPNATIINAGQREWAEMVNDGQEYYKGLHS